MSITIQHLTKTAKDGPLLIDSDNRAYISPKELKDGTLSFRCKHYQSKIACKTFITTNSTMTIITKQLNNIHKCPQLTKSQILMIISHQKMKERIKNEGTSVGKIFKEECSKIFEQNPELKIKNDSQSQFK